jgi:hypothetical protein
MKLYKVVLLVIVLVIGAYYGGSYFNKKIVYKQIEKQVILDNLTEKVNELKGSLVNDLRQCESGGYNIDSGLITFDPHKTNKSVAPASIGLYQWKVDSIKHYYKTLYQKDITGKEAILIALDDEKSSQLTSDVIFKTDNGLSNWYNCSKKLGLQSRLNIINELLK